MLRIIVCFLMAAGIGISSCRTKESKLPPIPPAGEDLSEETIKLIDSLSAVLNYSDIVYDTSAAIQLINIMLDASSQRRNNIDLPGKIRLAAECAANIREYNSALTLFRNLYQKYPDHHLAPFALFHMGFLYDESFGDKENAKKFYDEFLEVFPNHEYAKSVKELKMYIELTPEELFNKLLERGQEYKPEEEPQQ